MEQAALANKPDLAMPILDHLADPPNKVSIAVISIVSKCSSCWIELVEAAVFGAKPERTAAVLGDALDRGATETIGIVGDMKVAGTAFGFRVEFVHPGVGGDPQIAVIVLHKVLQKVGDQAAGVVGVVFVYDEGVAVIAIEAVPGGKPHQAPAVLQDGNDIALREAIVGGEVSESEVPRQSMGFLRMDIPRVARNGVSSGFGVRAKSGFHSRVREECVTPLGNYDSGGGGFSSYGRGTVNHAQKQDPARLTQGPRCISADGDHAVHANFCDSQELRRAVVYAEGAGVMP